MKIECYGIGPLGTNCYFVRQEETKELLIIDPGDFPDYLRRYIVTEKLIPSAVLLTHGHFDHILGLRGWRVDYKDIPVYISEAEKDMLRDPSLNGTQDYREYAISMEADHYLKDGETFSLIGEKITFLQTPGHTAGSGCYYFSDHGVLFSGDTLFHGSVGRWDMATGSYEDLMDSLNNKLLALPDETVVYPGHESETTIAEEKKFNPYVR